MTHCASGLQREKECANRERHRKDYFKAVVSFFKIGPHDPECPVFITEKRVTEQTVSGTIHLSSRQNLRMITVWNVLWRIDISSNQWRIFHLEFGFFS